MKKKFRKIIKSALVQNGLEMKLPLGLICWPFHYSNYIKHLIPLPATRIGILLNRDPEKVKNYRLRDTITDDDKVAIVKKQYKKRLGREPRLEPPVSFTEKLNYMKLFYEDERITQCCDKFRLKEYIRKNLGEGYCAETYYSCTRFFLRDFDRLPRRFALKVNWSSGYNIFVRDKDSLSVREKCLIVWQLKEWTKAYANSYYSSWYQGYKTVSPVIYAEELLPDDFTKQEYKVFCFSGKPAFVLIEMEPNSAYHRRACVDLKGDRLPFTFGTGPQAEHYTLPDCFGEILKTAEILAKDFPFVRVDYYVGEGRLLIGEMTFYSGGGYSTVVPQSWDEKLGEQFKLEITNTRRNRYT